MWVNIQSALAENLHRLCESERFDSQLFTLKTPRALSCPPSCRLNYTGRQADRHRQSIKQRKKSQTPWSAQFRPHCWESAVAGGNGWKTLRALLAGILAAWLQPIISYFVRGMMRGFRPFYSDHAGKAPPLLAASSSRRMLLKQSVSWKVTRSKIQKFMTSGTPPQEQ